MQTFLLETARLRLTSFAADDAEALYAYLSDPEVVRHEPYDPFTREQARAEAARRADDPEFIAVRRKDTGEMIGNFYFAPRDFEAWEVGYVFSRAHWGQGFATEGLMALTEYAFSHRNAHRVYAECNPENPHSWRLLERAGFRREARLVQNVFFRRDGAGRPEWLDTYIYARVALA